MKKYSKKVIFLLFFRRIYRDLLSSLHNFRKKITIFLFFVVLATIAWFLRALNDPYVAELKYPVNYINPPPNFVLTQAPPQQLVLVIKSDGYSILSNILKIKRPLRFDVNSFSLYALNNDSTSVYMITRLARDKLTSELNKLNKNIEILDIHPDTIFFNFLRLAKKKVPVVIQVKKNNSLYAQQYMLNGAPRIEPDSVIVMGPSYMIDTVYSVYTRNLQLENLTDTIRVTLPLSKHPHMMYSTDKIHVIIPVDRFTESGFDIPITTINVPDSLVLKTFPKSVHIGYLVTLSYYNKVDPSGFHAYVDYLTINSETSSRIKVRVDTLPLFIHNVKISPQNVEFIIEKQSTKSWSYRGNR